MEFYHIYFGTVFCYEDCYSLLTDSTAFYSFFSSLFQFSFSFYFVLSLSPPFSSLISLIGIPSKNIIDFTITSIEVSTESAKLCAAFSQTKVWIGVPAFLVIASKRRPCRYGTRRSLAPRNWRVGIFMGWVIGDCQYIWRQS